LAVWRAGELRCDGTKTGRRSPRAIRVSLARIKGRIKGKQVREEMAAEMNKSVGPSEKKYRFAYYL